MARRRRRDGMDERHPLCFRCKCERARAVVRQREALCASCLEEVLHLRFKSQLRRDPRLDSRTKNRPSKRTSKEASAEERTTKLAMACSGGIASSAMLRMLAHVQSREQGRAERGRIAFAMEAYVVDESCLADEQDEGTTKSFAARVAEEVVNIVEESRKTQADAESCAGRAEFLDFRAHVLPLEDVFDETSNGTERRRRCRELVLGVRDETGREDLIAHLRMQRLRAAAESGSVDLLLLGECATRMAVRAIAETVKGKGYAMPGNIQLADNRLGKDRPTVLRPLRDSVAKELAFYCHFAGLRLHEKPWRVVQGTTLNGLSDEFVATLQANLPSSVSTVFRTVEKIQAFPFNQEWEELNLEFQSSCTMKPAKAPTLCTLCLAPLSKRELNAKDQVGQMKKQEGPVLCRSCLVQIVGTDTTVVANLPQSMRHRSGDCVEEKSQRNEAARAYVAEYLLDGDE